MLEPEPVQWSEGFYHDALEWVTPEVVSEIGEPALRQILNIKQCICDEGFLPLPDGGQIACHVCHN